MYHLNEQKIQKRETEQKVLILDVDSTFSH